MQRPHFCFHITSFHLGSIWFVWHTLMASEMHAALVEISWTSSEIYTSHIFVYTSVCPQLGYSNWKSSLRSFFVYCFALCYCLSKWWPQVIYQEITYRRSCLGRHNERIPNHIMLRASSDYIFMVNLLFNIVFKGCPSFMCYWHPTLERFRMPLCT